MINSGCEDNESYLAIDHNEGTAGVELRGGGVGVGDVDRHSLRAAHTLL